MAQLQAAWVKQLGTSESDFQNAVAADANGNVFICGSTMGSFERRGHTGFNEEDAFLAKYDVNGNHQWVRQLGTSKRDTAEGIVADHEGNVIVCGLTYGELEEGKQKGAYTCDYFIAKYNTNGDQLWVRQSGTTHNDFLTTVAMDPAGNTLLGGYTYGEVAPGKKKGSWDSFMVKYDNDGRQIWVNQFGTTKSDILFGIATDQTGNIFATGYTTGSFPGFTSNGNNDRDAIIAKFDQEGNMLWVRQLGTTEVQEGKGIACDQAGNAFICGYTRGALSGNHNYGLMDFFLAKYNSEGEQEWIKQLGSSNNDSANAIAIDNSGNIFICGYAFDPNGIETPEDGTISILVRYNSEGVLLSLNRIGNGRTTVGRSLTTDPAGNIIISGYTYDELEQGQKGGKTDAFIAKIIGTETAKRLYSCTIKTSNSTFHDKTNIRIRLWGEEGTTDWMSYSVSLISQASFQIDPLRKIGRILACGFEIDKIDGEWPSSSVRLDSINIKKDTSQEEVTFKVNRTLETKMGFRVYLSPQGPLPRPADIEEPANAVHLLDDSFFAAHWMIAHSKKEQNILNTFLNSNSSKIVGVKWGLAFQAPETDSSPLKDAVNEHISSADDQATWDILKPRLNDYIDSRSFLMDLLDERMSVFLEDLRRKMISELELVKVEFALKNMTESEALNLNSSTNAVVSSVFGGAAAAATLFAAVPFPPLQIGATIFAGLFSMVSVVASATDPGRENDSSNDFVREADKLTLKGADISLNYYRFFQKFETSRRLLKKLALHSLSLLESFALLEAGFKQGGIQGLPDRYAPREVGLRPLLKLAYDDLLKSRGILLGEELEVINSPYDRQQSQSAWYSGVTGRLKEDTIGLTRHFAGFPSVKRWTCHQWRLMKDPVDNPSEFSEQARNRIYWLYPDGRDLLKLLPEKRYVQPALCQVIENETDKGWKYYAYQTKVSYWRPSTIVNWVLDEYFIEPENKPLLEIKKGLGVTKQTKYGPVMYWWTPSWNRSTFIWFNWVVGKLDDWVVFKWTIDWEDVNTVRAENNKEQFFYQESL